MPVLHLPPCASRYRIHGWPARPAPQPLRLKVRCLPKLLLLRSQETTAAASGH